MEDCMTDQSHAFRKGVELGPLKPTCTDSDRAKLTADRLEGVVRMPMQALDMKQASACLLASIGTRGNDVDAYVVAIKEQEVQAGGVRTTACDAIWPAGTLAYRCRSCQSSGNSAICKECFQAGDHSGHDYALYFSQGGGCCDCGDSAAWSPSGFCHKHSGQDTEEQLELEPLEAVTLAAVLSWAVYQLCWTLHVCAQTKGTHKVQAVSAASHLLKWLRSLCVVPMLRRQASTAMLQSQLSLHSALAKAADHCEFEDLALDRILTDFFKLPQNLTQEVTTLLLQLLFEPSFKKGFLPVMMRHYTHLLRSWFDDSLAAGQPLDMITVQLFNDMDAVDKPYELLEVLVEELTHLMPASIQKWTSGATTILLNKPMTRVVQDIKMVLEHPRGAADFIRHYMLDWTLALACMTNLCQYERQLGIHAQWEDDSWLPPVQLEMMIFHYTLLPVLSVVLNGRHADVPLSQLAADLYALISAQAAMIVQPQDSDESMLRCTREHCAGCGIWNHLLNRHPVSMHYPRLRAFALSHKALLGLHAQAMAAGNAADTQVMDGMLRSLFAQSCVKIELKDRWLRVGLYQEFAQKALMIQVWRAQVQVGLWVRNGPEVGQVHRLYQGAYWNEASYDLDMLLLQLWMARSDPDQVLLDFVCAFGGERILQAVWSSNRQACALPPCPALNGTEPEPAVSLTALQAEANGTAPGDDVVPTHTSDAPSTQADDASVPTELIPEHQLQCIVQGMRLLVTLLRDNHTWEPDAEKQLRWHVVHWLCLSDSTYTELTGALPSQLAAQQEALDKVLAEVATFVTPNTFERGRYCLKKQFWADFDPGFPYFNPQSRQAAVNRGLELKLWKPHQQLRGLVQGLPPGMEGLQAFTKTHFGKSLVRVCLSYCARHPSSATEDLALAAMNLLALTMPALPSASPQPGMQPASQTSPPLMPRSAAVANATEFDSLAELEALFGPSASQHSFELQDCAEHLHQHIISLRHQHSLTPAGHEAGGSSPPVIVHSSTTAEATTVIGRRSGPKPTGADGAGNAAGARKAQAKARQAAMMARMKQQQARFKDAGSEGDAPNVDKDEDMMDAGEQGAGMSKVRVGGSEGVAGPLGRHDQQTRGVVEGECAFCGNGNETEPLGWVVQLHCSAMPSSAQTPPPAWQDTPCDPLGPHINPRDVGLSLLDEQAGPHVLCCGHMLHETCLARHRAALVQQQEEDEFSEGVDLVDLRDKEFLCPVCRRLGNTLLPALTPPSPPLHPSGLPPKEGLLQSQAEILASSSGEGQEGAGLAGQQSNTAPEAGLQQLVTNVEALTQTQQQNQDVSDTQPASESGRQGILVSQMQSDMRLWGRRQALTNAFLKDARALMLTTLDALQRHAAKQAASAQQADTQTQKQGRIDDAQTAAYLKHSAAAKEYQTKRTQLQDISKGSLLWSVWAHNVVMWEVRERSKSAHAESEAVRSAHWRGMQSLAALCLAYGPGIATAPGLPANTDLQVQLQWLIGIDQVPLAPAVSALSMSPLVALDERAGDQGMLPWRRMLRADLPDRSADTPMTETMSSHERQQLSSSLRRWDQLVADPFGLLMHLFASSLASQCSSAQQACPWDETRDGGSSPGDVAIALQKPAALLQALIQLVYRVLVVQAAVVMGYRKNADTGCHSTHDLVEAHPDSDSMHPDMPPRLLPFLRRACILQRQILSRSLVQQPDADLHCDKQAASSMARGSLQHSPEDEVKLLLHELALQSPTLVLGSLPSQPSFHTLYNRWTKLPGMASQKASDQSFRQQIQAGPRLMQLPHLFQDLFLHLAQAQCGQCGQQPKLPCLCLQCGAFMCAGDPSCRHPAGQGLCRPHATACGGGTCAFLLLTVTKVLLMSASRACLSPSPYLDDHGEEDIDLTRGRPLYLNLQRWERLNEVWASGAFDFDSPTFHAAFGGTARRAAQFWYRGGTFRQSRMAETSGVQESQEGAERTSLSSASTRDQQGVVSSMQTTMLALTERMQRLEQQPCSRCRDAEANAAEFLSHLSSELAKAKQRSSHLEKMNQRIAKWEAQVAAVYAQGPIQSDGADVGTGVLMRSDGSSVYM
ncbi:hypothetical protein WJX82_008779 [Trebouxia sp. C0006]